LLVSFPRTDPTCSYPSLPFTHCSRQFHTRAWWSIAYPATPPRHDIGRRGLFFACSRGPGSLQDVELGGSWTVESGPGYGSRFDHSFWAISSTLYPISKATTHRGKHERDADMRRADVPRTGLESLVAPASVSDEMRSSAPDLGMSLTRRETLGAEADPVTTQREEGRLGGTR
jgi:hypothetical protein